MSQANEELVRTLAKAFEEDGTAGVRAYFDAEIEWHEDPAFPEAGVYSGIEAVEAYMEQFFAEFAEIHYEVADTKAVADSVLAHMRINGVGRASGAEFTLEAWWVLTIRDDKVVRGFAYLDRDRALEAIRL